VSLLRRNRDVLNTNSSRCRCPGWAGVLPAVLLVAVLCGCEKFLAKPANPPSEKAAQSASPAAKPQTFSDEDEYSQALGMANRFCEAWRTGDASFARSLLTSRFVRRYPDARIDAALADTGNPAHAAYEVFEGRRMGDGRVEFKVRFFYRYAGLHSDRMEAPVGRLVLIPDAESQWKVDEFPLR